MRRGDPTFILTPPAPKSVPYAVLSALAVDLEGWGRERLLLVEGGRRFFLANPTALHLVRDAGTALGDVWRQPLPNGLVGSGEVHDLDGDGRDDLWFLLRGPCLWFCASGFQTLWGNGDGPFELGARGRSTLALDGARDVDGDGLHDAMVTGPAVLPAVSAREYDEGVIYTTVTEGWIDEPWLTTSVGDVNRDGLDDVVSSTFWPHSWTLALARGDGTFDVSDVPIPANGWQDAHLIDFDGDGALDLLVESSLYPGVANPSIAWGRGDGTFEPYVEIDLSARYRTLHHGDLDGDGRPDSIAVLDERPAPGLRRLAVFLTRERAFVAAGTLDVRTRGSPPVALADLDGDGRDDVVFGYEAEGTGASRLGWRPSRGDGGFGGRRDVVDEDLASLSAIEVTDFDLDGRPDLFVRMGRFLSPLRYHSLRNDGQGRFELMWAGEEIVDGQLDRLMDVDADGRPDLVSRADPYSYYALSNHELIIRPGDGLGGFLPPLPVRWMSFAGEPGVFRHEGTRDLVRLAGVEARIQLEVNPSRGYVLPADEGPPHVELRALPVLPEPGADMRLASTWRLATLPRDECDSAPRVTDRRVALPLLDASTPVSFRHSPITEVRVFEVPRTETREVLLSGPDEASARTAFAEALLAGGHPFAHMGTMRVTVSRGYGPPGGPTLAGARLVHRVRLEHGRVSEVEVTRPRADVTFRLEAEDAAGHRGVTEASYREARRRAIEELCADPGALPGTCGEPEIVPPPPRGGPRPDAEAPPGPGFDSTSNTAGAAFGG